MVELVAPKPASVRQTRVGSEQAGQRDATGVLCARFRVDAH